MSFIKLPSGNFINIDKIAYIDIGKEMHSINGRYIRKIGDSGPVYAFFFVSLKDVWDYEYDSVYYAKEKFNSIQEAEEFFEKIIVG